MLFRKLGVGPLTAFEWEDRVDLHGKDAIGNEADDAFWFVLFDATGPPYVSSGGLSTL